MQGGHLAAQIALEFLVVYSFVLLIFVILFALMVSQRATSLAQQQYATLQLQAQNLADVIDEAVDAGNGFSATVPLQSAVSSTVPYNLSVSSTGVVIAQEKIGTQVLSAYAFSSARTLTINGTLLPNGNGYLLPTSSGTLKVANSQGMIYIDNPPTTTVPLAYTMTLNQLQHVKAAIFNGISYIQTPFKNSAGSWTLAAWIDANSFQTTSLSIDHHCILDSDLSGSYGDGIGIENSPTWFQVEYNNGFLYYPYTFKTGTWYYLSVVYNTVSSTVTPYVNGNSLGSSSVSFSSSTYTTYTIGKDNPNNVYFNGIISNVQIYNTPLTSNQIMQLYQSGIGGAPISSAANVLGWWPLNGNANDYGIYANEGTPNNVPGYNSIVYMLVHTTLKSGANAANALVGGVTSNGIFTQNSMPNLAMYTNSTGYARAYITAPNVSRLNFTLFGLNTNGTLTGLTGNLVGWWPLEEGYGNAIYDLSTDNYNGVFNSPSWAPLTNQTNLAVANFNGVSGGGGNVIMPLTGPLEPSQVTVSAWFMEPSYGSITYPQVGAMASGFTQGYDILLPASGDHNAGMIIGSSGTECWAHSIPPIGSWVHIVGTFNGNNIIVYFNGASVATGTCGPVSYSGVSSPYVFFIPSGDTVYLSNVQIYSTPLTAAQVSQLYKEGIAGAPIENAGLVGWWPLAYTANDYSGNGNNGVPTNAVYNNVGYSAPVSAIQVASFNGVSSYILAGSPSSLNIGTNSFTVSAWVYANSWSTLPQLVGKEQSVSQAAGWDVGFMTNGQQEADINDGTYTGYTNIGTALSTNTWYNVVYVFSRSSTLTTYVNGAYSGSVSISAHSGSLSNSYPFIIGAYSGGGYINAFNGLISNVQIYNAPLTSQQVQQLYLQGLPLYNRLNVSFG
jgi:hypothetical protein